GPIPGPYFLGPTPRPRLEPQDLAEDRDLAGVISVALDDAVQQFVVAHAGAERAVAGIVGRLQELLVAHAAHDLHQLAMRGVERGERGGPPRGRGIADVRPVPLGRFAGGLAGRAPRHFVAPSGRVQDELPDRVRAVGRTLRGLFGGN